MTKLEVETTGAPVLSGKSGLGILSFDDELKDDVGFKVKKSSRSERMMREREKEKRVEEREKQRKVPANVCLVGLNYAVNLLVS